MRCKKLLKIITKCITSLQAVERHVQSIGRERTRINKNHIVVVDRFQQVERSVLGRNKEKSFAKSYEIQ